MEGWMEGQMEGWMEGWIEGQMDGRTDTVKTFCSLLHGFEGTTDFYSHLRAMLIVNLYGKQSVRVKFPLQTIFESVRSKL